ARRAVVQPHPLPRLAVQERGCLRHPDGAAGLCHPDAHQGVAHKDASLMLRYLNGGESHGKGLIAILEGVPSGLPLTADDINHDLARRQKGYGRGGRMRIEQDRVEFLSGVRKGFTLGTPVTLHVANRDWENW